MAKDTTTPFWQCKKQRLSLEQPLIMGVVNVTPDSFSDGGAHFDQAAAISHGKRLLAEGADILDIGGESSRPGAVEVTAVEECRRVVPVIKALAAAGDCLISIDTRKAEVARQALAAGAAIINDITALRGDREMAAVARETGAAVVLMHMQGMPATMQVAPHYEDVVGEVYEWLERRVEEAEAAGIAATQLAIDPGIGFGKTLEHNLALLGALRKFSEMGPPLLVGLSRKAFVGHVTGAPVTERLPGSLAALLWCVWRGAAILRVHDVRASREALKMATALAAHDASHS